MKETFAAIYEQVLNLYDGKFQLVYDAMFNGQGYIFIGLLFIGVPLIVVGVFYAERWFPYLTAWHWVLTVVIGLVIVFASTISIYNTTIFGTGNQQLITALADPESGYYEHASILRYYYGIYNVLFAFIFSVIWSAIFKRFSKLHSHLPI